MRASFLAVILAALLLAACGEEDGGQPATPPEPTGPPAEPAEPRGEETVPEASPAQPVDDENRIRGTIRAVLTDPDSPTICTELVSERLLDEAYGNLQGCLDGRPRDSLATEVEVSGIELDDGTASAAAEAEGGVYGDETIEVGLVRSGGRWLVDTLRADVPVGP